MLFSTTLCYADTAQSSVCPSARSIETHTRSDVIEVDVDVVITVGALLFMVEAIGMQELVHDGAVTVDAAWS